MRGSGAFRAAVSPGGVLAGPWVRDELWRRARTVPSLDLRFAERKSLTDAVSNQSLVTFTRASSATYIDSAGTLQTAAVDVPRFDHNPTTGESLGLLVEEQRTNSVTNNTMVGAVAGTPGTLPTGWGTFVSPTGLTRTIVGSGTVNGINYIDVRFNGTPSSTGEITLYLSPVTTATLAQAWTATAWLSLAGGSTSNIGGISLRNFELNSGAYVREISTNFVSSISSDFVRRQNITTSFGASANQIQSVLSITAAAGGTPIDITLRIGLPQLEQGAFATSVILTDNTAPFGKTRNADVANITGTNFSSWYRQDEGTVFASAGVQDFTQTNFPRLFSLDRADASTNFIAAVRGSSTRRLDYSVFADAAGQAVGLNNGIAPAANTTVNGAWVYKANDFIGATGGVLTNSDTSGSVPTLLTTLGIGMQGNATLHYNGTIRRLTYWPVRLGNNVLQQVTQ